ncbi:universal stress protein [Actinomadura atramentaria]|uniref:universal stress protein n=1 Tax=Actinomadura atramentaria TaxID=1990 RepID=UPI000380C1BF|nr:universal stress protein [Actinomadura atramentaria]
MTEPRVLVGYAPDDRGDDALALAVRYARATGAALTAAHVRPPGWPARGPASVDAEWTSYLREQSTAVLDRAAERLAGTGLERSAAYVSHAHRGSGRGLAEVARDAGAGTIVIGSAPRGRRGRIAIGSTADQLLHGAPAPVLLAPRGYAEDPPDALTRLTVAYRRGRGTRGPLAAAARLGADLGVPVRLVSLVLHPAGLPARFRGGSADVVARQRAEAEQDLESAAEAVRADLAAGPTAVPVETVAADGAGIPAALGSVPMEPGEILACQSSHDGPLRKVFLGESSGKIVRAACCPVVVLPRGTTAE